MEQKKTRNKIIILFFVVIIIILLLCVSILFVIKENSECSRNPFNAVIERLEDGGFNDSVCSCASLDPTLIPIWFDREGLYLENPLYKTNETVNYYAG